MSEKEIQQIREAICNEYRVPVDMVFPKTPVHISEESAKAARRLNQQKKVMETSPLNDYKY